MQKPLLLLFEEIRRLKLQISTPIFCLEQWTEQTPHCSCRPLVKPPADSAQTHKWFSRRKSEKSHSVILVIHLIMELFHYAIGFIIHFATTFDVFLVFLWRSRGLWWLGLHIYFLVCGFCVIIVFLVLLKMVFKRL